ncbi:protein of unknown function [Zobellia uliginosa]|uniref:Uncharacterized protein n=1 Tax=Zobellia uliginosa TaxID=143224 RepID=A0ABY1KLQ1_9FLAO|nr:protein of unknown function [Zobellia uliginosa]
MSFWKNLFSGKKEKPKTESHFDQYRNELNQLNLKTISDLENLVKPLIRTATKLEVLSASRPPENAQFISHFGGRPYFEKGEVWPTNKKGKNLEFIFQVFNSTDLKLPKSIELIQFYYDWDEMPWDTSDDGWLVKIYKKIEKGNIKLIDTPSELEKSRYCEIKFSSTQSLPDWEGIDLYCRNASKMSCVLDEDEPWGSYDQIVTKLIGEQDYQSQLGGISQMGSRRIYTNRQRRKPTKTIVSNRLGRQCWINVGRCWINLCFL